MSSPFNMNDDLYHILGVSSQATDVEIRKSYLKKVRWMHPDKQPSTANEKDVHEAFTRLQNAYEILRDQRAAYDAVRKRYSSNSGDSTHKSSTASSSVPPQSKPSAGQPKHDYYNYSSKTNSSGTKQQQYGRKESNSHHSSSYQRSTSYEKEHQQNQQSSSNYRYSQDSKFYGKQNSQYRSNFSTNGTYPSTGSYQRSSHAPKSDYSSHYTSSDEKRSSSNSSHYQSNKTTNEGHKAKSSNNKSRKATTFGVTNNGEPCNRCLQQGGYCWQHEWQSNNHNTNPKKKNTRSGATDGGKATRIWGVTSAGIPCQRCQNEGRYCWQHEWQDSHSSTKKEKRTTKPSATSPVQNYGRIWGVTASGIPCQKCLQKGGYCWQHEWQDITSYKNINKESDKSEKAKREKKGHSSKCYGVTKKGLPCRRCISKGGFCHLHIGQQCS